MSEVSAQKDRCRRTKGGLTEVEKEISSELDGFFHKSRTFTDHESSHMI